jgi:hypothetical protein
MRPEDLVTSAGATPLDLDALAGLIPGLSAQGELNEFEARNIAAALRWGGTHPHPPKRTPDATRAAPAAPADVGPDLALGGRVPSDRHQIKRVNKRPS